MESFDIDFKVCPHCGFVVGAPVEEAIHMKPGTVLHDRYIIGKVQGYGGFGVTYIGWDGKLEQKVAIKEYLPSEFSTRMPGRSRVTVFNGEKSEQFHDGLKKFIDEAKRLARFQKEPGIVRIFDSFEENDTAYIVMEFLEGETLKSYLARENTIPENKAVEMMIPIMKSLQAVHAEGLLHRDIAPDNIFLTKSGEVKLIDFGASRYATTVYSRSLTVIIKPGFSPEEQYRSKGDQGPHTDVYAIAATLYKMITGKTPPDAMERRAKYESKNRDILEEPHKINKDISVNRENAILNAMNVRIEDRTPDIATFMKELDADPPVKRRYGKIRKIDLYSWPLWVKILIPVLLAGVLTLGVLLMTGVIDFSKYSDKVVIPDNIMITPDVEGTDKDEAIKIIEESGLLASIEKSVESEYVSEGRIIMQTPVGGAYLEKNGLVLLTICSGKIIGPEDGIATVPFLVGDTKEVAIDKLKKAGLGEPEIKEVSDENVAAGLVISASKESGEEVPVGTVLTLKISTGPAAFKMPDVKGQKEDAAKAKLEGLGLVVTVEYEKSDTVPEECVIKQSVAKNTEVKRGAKVTLTVSSSEKTVKVEDVKGKTRDEAESILKKQGFAVYVRENYDDTVPKGCVISQSPDSGTLQKEGSTITLFVSAGKPAVSVSYNGNGGSVSKTQDYRDADGTYGSMPTPTRTGYTFIGWYTSPDGGVEVNSSTTLYTQTNHTLYAHWTVNTYTVTFNANGGYVTPASKAVTYASTYGDLPTPSKGGYDFAGWFTAASGGSQVTSGMTVAITSGQTLYAHWTAAKITVMFDPCGGSTPTGSKSVTFGDAYGTLPTPSRTGYTFAGWFTAASGGSQVTQGSKMTATSAHSLYAHWTANKYTVTFNPAGGKVGQTSATVTFGGTYGSLPVPTKDYAYFVGWYTAAGGGTKIEPGTKVSTAENHTLYAHWGAESFTVTLNPAGGVVNPTTVQVKYKGTYGDLPIPTKTGAYFIGWFTAPGESTQITADTVLSDPGNRTIYAHWGANKYTLTFNPNGGTVAETSREVKFDKEYGTLPTPSRSGYKFAGWYTAASGGSQVTASTKMGASNVTIYAHWTK